MLYATKIILQTVQIYCKMQRQGSVLSKRRFVNRYRNLRFRQGNALSLRFIFYKIKTHKQSILNFYIIVSINTIFAIILM